MLISEFVESVREDFKNLAEIAGAEAVSTVGRLGAAFEPALQKHFLDALNSIVQEFNLLDGAPLTLNFEGDDVHLARLVAPSTDASASPGDYSARIALRLNDELKTSIEHLATDVGSSVNSWIVRSLERSVLTDPSGTVLGKRQLRGKGRA
jgi:predicted HicB family RNase H-like nuclease